MNKVTGQPSTSVLGHVLIGASVSAFALALGVAMFPVGHSTRTADLRLASDVHMLSAPMNPRAVASQVIPGLVDIDTVLGDQGAAAAGTGIVLSPNGEILTNNHVVEGATSIVVTDLGNGRRYTGTVVGYDRTQDVAVVQLQGASGLTTAPIGDSNGVVRGEQVVAIGNAGGAGTPSVAPGAVTDLGQAITATDDTGASSEQLTGLIQTNADVVPGDSGGPLVDPSARVVGMDTAASAGYQLQTPLGGFGVNVGPHEGFAIPIDQATSLARQIESGRASTTVHIGPTAFLGVEIAAPQQGAGAQVMGTVAGAPAARAGLPQGAVITAVDGHPIGSPTDLTNLMDTEHPGQPLQVTWILGNTTQVTTVVPAAGPVG
ncbi:S1C family serine protease [Corynebacteriales bacterium D3-21]|uniref:S1C family serine protease n=2 Tax=Speluncibacter jeojiensis TaxID=2710754 RepID=A0A9X4M4D2_9ACTN|nr:trypsin-like peptidase domain-containing protein [Rhodococcus sp. D2-41]MDG3016604.1 S1C family serine protease [Corynebacteriales bacterium D3-21]